MYESGACSERRGSHDAWLASLVSTGKNVSRPAGEISFIIFVREVFCTIFSLLKNNRCRMEAASEEKEKTPVDRGEREGEAEVSRKEEGRQSQQPVKSQNANGGGNQTKSAPEVSAVLTAAQEAHLKVYSHASGEAWLTQVRP
ncbi:hypothetical protein NDU88_002222 [Pleurodeles waltl]|uniref:Uncharacterized protein n=1 Tax=Pleurodeles waltl TaxID=8319 RepID=A0AAV7UAM1_PLEWA|nr:hypothetical protein NDU88_002222 [Pleurodeles waltl]